jgi:hypothetical protein
MGRRNGRMDEWGQQRQPAKISGIAEPGNNKQTQPPTAGVAAPFWSLSSVALAGDQCRGSWEAEEANGSSFSINKCLGMKKPKKKGRKKVRNEVK